MIPLVTKGGIMTPGVRRGLKFGGMVFFCYLLFCELFFITHVTGGVFLGLSRLVFVPAAVVEGQSLSYHTVAEMTHAEQGFGNLEKHKQAFDRALAISVYRLYVVRLAEAHGLEVSREELAAYPLEAAVIAPGLEKAHWQEKDYRNYIVEPLLLAQKTAVAVADDDTYQAEALKSMDSLRKKIEQGMPFADVAQKFSQDTSAAVRGDLGIMSMSTLPTWLLPAVTLVDKDVGAISDVLSAPDAYWTVTLVEFFPSEIPEQAAIHFRGVAVKKKTFGTIVNDALSEHPPWVFVW